MIKKFALSISCLFILTFYPAVSQAVTCQSGYIEYNDSCYKKLACENGGTQQADACVCKNGWTGTLCQTAKACTGYDYTKCPTGYLVSSSCMSGDTKKLKCGKCATGYVRQGTKCYKKLSCQNGTQEANTCVCKEGWEGTLCQTAKTCSGYTRTSCPTGYVVNTSCTSGNTKYVKCKINPCTGYDYTKCPTGYATSATCTSGSTKKLKCGKCATGYIKQGTKCYKKLACKNEGTQKANACVCKDGWTGTLCQTAKTCTGYDYTACPTGYAASASCMSGNTKKLKCDKCATGYVQQNGKCYKKRNCENGGVQEADKCVCPAGWAGGYCRTAKTCPGYDYTACPTGYASSASCMAGDTKKLKCDKCATGYIQQNGKCYKKRNCENGGVQEADKCVCPAGWIGGYCRTKATCAYSTTSCDSGYHATGKTCQSGNDKYVECEINSCTGYYTTCPKDYYIVEGDTCQSGSVIMYKCKTDLTDFDNGSPIIKKELTEDDNVVTWDDGEGNQDITTVNNEDLKVVTNAESTVTGVLSTQDEVANAYADEGSKIVTVDIEQRGNGDVYGMRAELGDEVGDGFDVDNALSAGTAEVTSTIKINNKGNGNTYGMYTNTDLSDPESEGIYMSNVWADIESTGTGVIDITNSGNGNVYGMFADEISDTDKNIETVNAQADEKAVGGGIIKINKIGNGDVYGMKAKSWAVNASAHGQDEIVNQSTANGVININQSGNGNVYGIYANRAINASTGGGKETSGLIRIYGSNAFYENLTSKIYGIVGKTIDNAVSDEGKKATGIINIIVEKLQDGSVYAYGMYSDIEGNRINNVSTDTVASTVEMVNLSPYTGTEIVGIYSQNGTVNNSGDIILHNLGSGFAYGIKADNATVYNSGDITVDNSNFVDTMATIDASDDLTYAPLNDSEAGNYGIEASNSQITNSGAITIHGVRGINNTNGIVNNSGTINVYGFEGIVATNGSVFNEGTLTVNGNGLGIIADNVTNNGEININGNGVGIDIDVDNGLATNDGKIEINNVIQYDGPDTCGIRVDGATAVNNGSIIINYTGKETQVPDEGSDIPIGMVGSNGATLTNSETGIIKVQSTQVGRGMVNYYDNAIPGSMRNYGLIEVSSAPNTQGVQLSGMETYSSSSTVINEGTINLYGNQTSYISGLSAEFSDSSLINNGTINIVHTGNGTVIGIPGINNETGHIKIKNEGDGEVTGVLYSINYGLVEIENEGKGNICGVDGYSENTTGKVIIHNTGDAFITDGYVAESEIYNEGDGNIKILADSALVSNIGNGNISIKSANTVKIDNNGNGNIDNISQAQNLIIRNVGNGSVFGSKNGAGAISAAITNTGTGAAYGFWSDANYFDSDNDIAVSLVSKGSGNAYGMYFDGLNGNNTSNINSDIKMANKADGLAVGIYANNSNITNTGDITIHNLGSGTAVGIFAEGTSNIVNSGNITIDRKSFLDENTFSGNSISYSASDETGGKAVGIYGSGESTITNAESGVIRISGADKTIGIYSEGGNVYNYGTIILDNKECAGAVCESVQNAIRLYGGKLFQEGKMITDANWDSAPNDPRGVIGTLSNVNNNNLRVENYNTERNAYGMLNDKNLNVINSMVETEGQDAQISILNRGDGHVYGMYGHYVTNVGVTENFGSGSVIIDNNGNGDVYGLAGFKQNAFAGEEWGASNTDIVDKNALLRGDVSAQALINITNIGSGHIYGLFAELADKEDSKIGNAQNAYGGSTAEIVIDNTNTTTTRSNVYGIYADEAVNATSFAQNEANGVIDITNIGKSDIYGVYGKKVKNAEAKNGDKAVAKGDISIYNIGVGNVTGIQGSVFNSDKTAHNAWVESADSAIGNINITNKYGNVYGIKGDGLVYNAEARNNGEAKGRIEISDTEGGNIYGIAANFVYNAQSGYYLGDDGDFDVLSAQGVVSINSNSNVNVYGLKADSRAYNVKADDGYATGIIRVSYNGEGNAYGIWSNGRAAGDEIASYNASINNAYNSCVGSDDCGKGTAWANGQIIMINKNSGNAYAMYSAATGNMILNTNRVNFGKGVSSIISMGNVGDGLSVAMYSKNGVIENTGDIKIQNIANGTAIGLYADGNTRVINTGNITIDHRKIIDDNATPEGDDDVLYSPAEDNEVSGRAIGIYGAADSSIYNSGTIVIDGAKEAYGIYSEGGDVENIGDVVIDGRVTENSIRLNGGKLLQNGLLIAGADWNDNGQSGSYNCVNGEWNGKECVCNQGWSGVSCDEANSCPRKYTTMDCVEGYHADPDDICWSGNTPMHVCVIDEIVNKDEVVVRTLTDKDLIVHTDAEGGKDIVAVNNEDVYAEETAANYLVGVDVPKNYAVNSMAKDGDAYYSISLTQHGTGDVYGMRHMESKEDFAPEDEGEQLNMVNANTTDSYQTTGDISVYDYSNYDKSDKNIYGMYSNAAYMDIYNVGSSDTAMAKSLATGNIYIDNNSDKNVYGIYSQGMAVNAESDASGRSVGNISIYNYGNGDIYGIYGASRVYNAVSYNNGISEANISISNNGNGNSYGMFGKNVYNISDDDNNTSVVEMYNYGEGLAVGLYAKDGEIENSGDINIHNAGNGTAVGIMADGSTEVVNSGTITIDRKYYSGSEIGGKAVGIYGSKDSGISNRGTITINGAKMAYGIYSEGGEVSNRGTISIDGTECEGDDCFAPSHAIMLNGGKLFQDGKLIAGAYWGNAVDDDEMLIGSTDTLNNENIILNNDNKRDVYGMYNIGNSLYNSNKLGTGLININNVGGGSVYGIYTGDEGWATNSSAGEGIIRINNTGGGNVYGIQSGYTQNATRNNGNETGKVIVVNNGSGNAYGLHGKKVYSETNEDFNQYSEIEMANRGDGLAVGMYGTEYVKNSGAITIHNLGNGTAVGMYGDEGAEIDNTGIITIDRSSYTDHVNIIPSRSDPTYSADTETGGKAIGIYGAADTEIDNDGIINISGTADAYGIWSEGGDVENDGVIIINGNENSANAIRLNAGTLFQNGTLAATPEWSNTGDDYVDPESEENWNYIANNTAIEPITENSANDAVGYEGVSKTVINAFAYPNNAGGSIDVTQNGSGSVYGIHGLAGDTDDEEDNEVFNAVSYSANTAIGSIRVTNTGDGDGDSAVYGMYGSTEDMFVGNATNDEKYAQEGMQSTGTIEIVSSGNKNVYGIYSNEEAINAESDEFGTATGTITIENDNGTGDVYGLRSHDRAYNADATEAASATGHINISNNGSGDVYGIFSERSDIFNSAAGHDRGLGQTKDSSYTDGLVNVYNNGKGSAYGMKGVLENDWNKSIFNARASFNGVAVGRVRVVNLSDGNLYGIYGTVLRNADVGGTANPKYTPRATGVINVISADGKAYGMYGRYVYNQSDANRSSTIEMTNTGSGLAAGMYAQNGNITNSGDIIIHNLGNGKAVGIIAEGSTGVYNSGNITIDRASYFDDLGKQTYSAPDNALYGGTAIGIYGGENTSINNEGNITITKASNAFGIWSDGGYVTNTGSISIDGSKCTGDDCFTATNAIILNGGTLFQDGELRVSEIVAPGTGNGRSASGSDNPRNAPKNTGDESEPTRGMASLNLNDFGGTVVASGTSQFIAEGSISGDLAINNNVIENGFDTTYTVVDMIQAGDVSGLNLISQSALFDASLENGTDAVMTMKSFNEVVNNQSLADFLKQNYDAENNEALFSMLKNHETAAALNETLDSIIGNEVFNRFNFEDITIMRELNMDVNNTLFNNNEDNLITSGNIAPFYFESENGAAGKYALYNRRIGKKSFGLSLAFSNVNSRDRKDNNSREDESFQMSVPFGYKARGFNFITAPRFGYAYGHYDRDGFENTVYKGTMEKRMFGLMNEVRYPIKLGGWKIAPAAEFNMLGYHLKGGENAQVYSLNIKSQNNYSVETGLGIYANREFKPSKNSVLNFNAGVAAYHEFADPYTVELGMHNMDGSFKLRDERRKDNRAVVRTGFDYSYGDITLEGSFATFVDGTTHTRAGVDLRYNF